jgi:hypothetical protein
MRQSDCIDENWGYGCSYLLEAVGHGPPFPHFGVIPHALHVASEVISDILEACEEDGGTRIVEDAVCNLGDAVSCLRYT